MKKIYILPLIIVLVFFFPKHASALAMQLTVHISSLTIPSRSMALSPAVTTPTAGLEYKFDSTNGLQNPHLAIWQDTILNVSGHSSVIRNYVGTVASSTSAVTLPVSTPPVDVTFLVPSGLSYTSGARLRIVSHSNLGNWLEGYIRSYSGTSLIITVDKQNGSGTNISDWDISTGPIEIAISTFTSGILQGDTSLGTGSNATVYFDYYSGHTYGAYIGITTDCRANTNYSCRADCTVAPPVPTGKYACYIIYMGVYKSSGWANASCADPNCGNSAAVYSSNFLYVGDRYIGEDGIFYIYLAPVGV